MSSLKTIEKNKIEKLFEMGGGYVLNFSNNSFSQFFRDNVNIDIDDTKYLFIGSSKANRMRAFLELESDELVGKALIEMLELWKFINNDNIKANRLLANECAQIVSRLLKKQIVEKDNVENFLKKNFYNTSLNKIQMDGGLLPIMEARLQEVYKCMQINASLSVVILCGSILEGLLLGLACQNPTKFSQANSSPKDKQGIVKKFPEWTLESLINVAHEIGFLQLDVKNYGMVLRKFRNYIHPLEQFVTKFNPDIHTAQISLQVLKAAIADLSGERENKPHHKNVWDRPCISA